MADGGGAPINPASLPPGDPRLILLVLEQLKSRGLFGSLHRDCADTQPASVDTSAPTTGESRGDQGPECAPVGRAQDYRSGRASPAEPHFPASGSASEA